MTSEAFGEVAVSTHPPTRVVQVVTQREPAGAQRVAHQLCQALRDRGIHSDLIFLYRRAEAFADEDYRDLRGTRPGPFSTIGLLVDLTRRLRRDRPDAIVAHTFHANVISCVAGALASVPRVVTVHHVLAGEESRARRLAVRALRGLRLLGTEVFVSQTTRESYGPAAARRGVVIHNGVEIPAKDDQPSGWARDPRTDPTRPLVLAIGRLAAQKDHETLIRAMRSVREADLAIVGEGELRAQLEHLIRRWGLTDRVTLAGSIEPTEVVHALAVADLVVQPSRWEAFSMVILEAMAAGKALVVSDIPAHREALAGIGRYHPVGDAEALAGAIRSVLEGPVRPSDQGSQARARAEQFGHDVCVDHYLQLLYGQPADGSRGAPDTYHRS